MNTQMEIIKLDFDKKVLPWPLNSMVTGILECNLYKTGPDYIPFKASRDLLAIHLWLLRLLANGLQCVMLLTSYYSLNFIFTGDETGDNFFSFIVSKADKIAFFETWFLCPSLLSHAADCHHKTLVMTDLSSIPYDCIVFRLYSDTN